MLASESQTVSPRKGIKDCVMTCFSITLHRIYLNCFCFTENVALKKRTWQLYPIPSINFSSNRAVDGRKSNHSVKGGECSASIYSKTEAEWWVDLGKVLSIHHIFIQYATNNQEWGEHFLTQIVHKHLDMVN